MGLKENKEQIIMRKIKDDFDIKNALASLKCSLYYDNKNDCLYIARKEEQVECNVFGLERGTITMISARTNSFDIAINITKHGLDYTYSNILFKEKNGNPQYIKNPRFAPKESIISKAKRYLIPKKKDRQ